MQNEQNDTVDVLGGSTIKECAKNNSGQNTKNNSFVSQIFLPNPRQKDSIWGILTAETDGEEGGG